MIMEHNRSVNRISCSPVDPFYLLSASQDATIKLWDLRSSNPSKSTIRGKSESVRDVQFSPNGVDFVAAFENGSLQRWDLRMLKLPLVKWNAHSTAALTVDWSSDGKIIASGGGRDKSIKIWNANSPNQRPSHVIHTIAPVYRVKWRPLSDNIIASVSLSFDAQVFVLTKVHVWDITKPNLAKFCSNHHSADITGILWADQDTIWSCSKDSVFAQVPLSQFYQPSSLLTLNCASWNSRGHVCFSIGSIDHETTQMTAINDFEIFDFETFDFLSKNYVFYSDSISVACEHNAKVKTLIKVAQSLGLVEHSEAWLTIKSLYEYSAEYEKVKVEEISISKSLSSDDLSSREADASSEESEILYGSGKLEVKQFENYFHSVGHGSTAHVNENQNLQFAQTPELNPQNIVKSILDYFASLGDVQICLAIALVLRNHFSLGSKLQQWHLAYTRLLSRFKMWNAVTELNNSCTFSSLISSLNLDSTSVFPCCNHCNAPINTTPSWACEKCKRILNPCSICHGIVKGLYFWCQACSHGGHMSCMRDWFESNMKCPTGCGHLCS
jgi:hypothetical protein